MSVKLEGFDQFAKKLQNKPKEIQKLVGVHVQNASLKWAREAKRAAPVDKGILRGGINAQKLTELSAEVTSNALYSPYVEWGTGTKVKVPQELQAYAIQFKGVRKVIGRYPKPFFFIHKNTIRKELETNIRKVLGEGN